MNDLKLFEGVTLSYCRFEQAHAHLHTPNEHIIEINYCKGGRIGWDMGDGCRIFLGPGDYSIHTLKACADSKVTLPQDYYEGLSLTLDLEVISAGGLPLLTENGIDPRRISERFCTDSRAACFSGTQATNELFRCFYEDGDPVFYKLKALELIAYLCVTGDDAFATPAEYRSEQVELARRVHDYLLSHIGERPTIEELARRFAVNPTTLKATFRAVYGDSIAAHTKGHRMGAAARMLTATSLSLNEIAEAVGYESQSKFTAAFREYSGENPSDYRKHNVTEV